MDNQNGQAPPPRKPEDYIANEAGDLNTLQNRPQPTQPQPPMPGTTQGNLPPAASQPTIQSPAAGYPPNPTVPNTPPGYDPSLDRTVPSVSNYWDNYPQGQQQPPTGYPPPNEPGYPTQPTYNTYSNDPYGTQGRNYGTPGRGTGGGGFGGIKPPYIVGAIGGLSMLIILCLIVVAIVLLSGGDDEQPSALDASPTPPSVAQQLTSSPVSGAVRSPTPLATLFNRPTPTPFSFATSALPPTIGVATQPSGSSNPLAIGISYPTDNLTLRGNVAILGSASHPNFVQYALEYGPDPNSGNLWYPITTIPITRTVVNNALGAWNTTAVADGNYQVRLHVWLNNGTEDFRIVRGLQVRNSNVPTLQTNRSPQISAISPVSLTKGKAVTIALGISDPDNDPVTYLAQTSNASLVTITPSGSAAITVNGLNVGSANITVSINDGRGGTASTSFSVTVTAPVQTNNPPSIAPIPSLSLTTGQVINLNLTVTDPENDAVNLTTSSSAAGIATPSVANRTLTIRGDKQGSVSINVVATDARGLTATVSFLVTVTDPVPTNRVPTIATVGNQTLDAAKTLDVPLTISDPDNDPLTITTVSSNDGVISAGMVGTNVVRLNGISGGNGVITITVDDKKGGVVTASFSVTVNAPPSPNQPPTIGIIPNQTLNLGDNLTVTATTSDPDGDTVSISAVASPDGILTLSTLGNDISISGSAEGTATVTVTASDGTTSATTSFSVQVAAQVNNPPVIDPISAPTCLEGDVLTVAFTYSDPDGDPVTASAANAADGAIATAALVDSNNIEVNCVGAGTTNVSVTVQDDQSAIGSLDFAVEVTAPANNNPTVDFIPDQNCTVGDNTTVVFTYSDPDGNPVSPVSANSDNPGSVAANLVDNNTIGLGCVGAGGANVTVTVQDDKGGTGSATFVVNSAAPVNNPPAVDFVNNQSCTAGDTLTVPFSYSDPDGNPVSPLAPSSDNPGAAAATLLDSNNLSISCVGAGNANITITVQDDGGQTATFSFSLSVAPLAVNNPPAVDFINAVTCNVGDTPTVSFTYSDPDGNPVSPLDQPVSDNPGVVTAIFADPNNISLNCLAEGSANVTVTVQDDGGQTANTSFGVVVAAVAPPPTFDVTVYQEVPDVNAIAGNLNTIVATGNSLGRQGTVFSYAGDESVNSPDFMGGFSGGSYNLGNNGDLQGTVDAYNGGGSFANVSHAADNGWTIEDLLDPSNTPGGIGCDGLSPLQCEINLKNPTVMFISFTPANVQGMPPDIFRSNLEQVVAILTSNGVIPVLATLPNDGSMDAATLAQYNEVIVTVATNAQVPLWNAYNTVQPFAGSGQVYAAGNGNAFDLSDAGLNSGGANRRNLTALRVLQTIKNTFYP